MDDENITYLKKTYPQRLSVIKNNKDDYLLYVMGDVKTYLQKKPSLIFQRSQEDLFIFGFYKEACLVSRVVLEDTLRQQYNPPRHMDLNGIINRYLTDYELKKLAHLIRVNGNDFAHESLLITEDDIFFQLSARNKAMESAKALNLLMVKLGFKTPKYD